MFYFLIKKIKSQELSQDLRNYGFSICFFHGELNQDERQLIYYKIKTLEYKIILSTDLLSRGIDLTAVNLVINFDSAFDSVEQSHRKGRTGRFFEKGLVISFIENKMCLNEIKNENCFDSNNIEKFLDIIKKEFDENKRLKKEDIDKINLGQNKNEDILKDALTEINGVNILLQKKRKLQYDKESLIKNGFLEKNENDNNSNDIEKNEEIEENENNKN